MNFFDSMEGIKLGNLSVSSILSAVVVFIICLIVIKIISALVKKLLERRVFDS